MQSPKPTFSTLSPSSSITESTLRPALKSQTSSSRPTSTIYGVSSTISPPTSGVKLLKHATFGSSNPPGYTNKVSFDTFENGAPSDASMFSFTLQTTSAGYHKSRNTRVFLCAVSPDQSGTDALDWTLESLVQEGDELIVVRGFDTDDLQKSTHDELRDQARELMKQILSKNSCYGSRSLSVIVEFVAGKITETIERLIALYRPDSLVVGTRGERGTLKTWGAVLGAPGMGSVSKYCVSHSPVPVIVVQPERKVRKTMEKRRADPKRSNEFNELLRPHLRLSEG